MAKRTSENDSLQFFALDTPILRSVRPEILFWVCRPRFLGCIDSFFGCVDLFLLGVLTSFFGCVFFVCVSTSFLGCVEVVFLAVKMSFRHCENVVSAS